MDKWVHYHRTNSSVIVPNHYSYNKSDLVLEGGVF